MKQRGLTLVELLIVIAVLAIAGTLILNIFTSTLRGSNKTQILGVIKQNGQAVLETMDKTVRNADNVVCISLNKTSLVVVNKGTYTRYRFVPPAPNANGFIQQDNPTKQIPQGQSQEETDPDFASRVCSDNDLMNQSTNVTTLTDTNPQTGVSMNCIEENCTPTENAVFTRDRSSGFKDQVTIKFIVGPGVDASSSIRGQIDPVRFATTITLR